MEVNDSILLQKQVKDNSEDLQNEFRDMLNWEKSMKEKEQDLLSELNEQMQLPPIRNRNNKKPATEENKTIEHSKRIKSYDYATLEKFDAKKACNDNGKEEKSDDLTKETLSEDEVQQNHNKAIEFKQEGNSFVQLKQWNNAIASYSKAIKLFPYDAIFYANRALCFLKQDSFYSAEADCTSSIQINDTYVKAYHRRATARMGLKQYKEAKHDIEKILTLEPSNKEVKALLCEVNKQFKQLKPVITSEKDIADNTLVEKNIERKLDVESNKKIIDTKEDKNNKNNINMKSTVKPTSANVIRPLRNSHVPDWLPEKDNVKIVELVKKPPHLRSKDLFKKINVQEADLTKPPKEEIEKSCTKSEDIKLLGVSPTNTIKSDENIKTEPAVEKNLSEIYIQIPPIPKTAVQFLTNWKKYTSSDFHYKYLKQLPPGSLPDIFKDSMESSIFSDILAILKTEFVNKKESIFSYLKDLSDVKRFRALVMFMSNSEKQDLKFMFSYCKTLEKISEEELAKVQDKYEI